MAVLKIFEFEGINETLRINETWRIINETLRFIDHASRARLLDCSKSAKTWKNDNAFII